MSDSKYPKIRDRRANKKVYNSLPSLAIDVLRVVPDSTRPTNNPRNDRLTDLIIVFAVFGIALWIRVWVSALIGLEGVYGTNLGGKCCQTFSVRNIVCVRIDRNFGVIFA